MPYIKRVSSIFLAALLQGFFKQNKTKNKNKFRSLKCSSQELCTSRCAEILTQIWVMLYVERVVVENKGCFG